MNFDAAPNSELDALMEGLLEEALQPEDAARLNFLLKTDSRARDRYLLYINLHAALRYDLTIDGPMDFSPDQDTSLSDAMILPALREEPEKPSGTPAITHGFSPARRPAASHRSWLLSRPAWLSAAALLLLCLGLFLLLTRRSGPTLVAEISATWDPSRGTPKVGGALPHSELQLTAGLARIQFATGAQVILEAPATVRVDEKNGMTLLSGKLTAMVPPPAHGFTVNTPLATLVDLGTEFGVNVRDDGGTDFDVFKGTVSISSQSTANAGAADAVILAAGSARHVAANGTVGQITSDPSAYLRGLDFDRLQTATASTSLARWQAYSQRLQANPDLVAYYPFERLPEALDHLVNRSSAGSSLDGVLGGGDPASRPQWSTGRWPGKSALAFLPGTTQHVALPDLPPLDFSRGSGVSSPFTICAWIRPASIPPATGGIIARGWSFHEQYAISFPPGGGALGVWIRDQYQPRTIGPSLTTDTELGVWHLVASVYDPGANLLRLFVDGRMVDQTKATPNLLSVPGPVYIGSRKDESSNLNLTFNGSIDEIAFFKTPLTAEAISEMYNAGKPD